MKILMVTMAMNIGGAETHILELCRALAAKGHTITLASNGGVYADMLVQEGISHVTLPLHTKKPAAVLKSYRGLQKCILEGDFDLVHAHARIPAWICGQLWKKYRFRFVTTAHLNFSLNPLWRMISCWGEQTMSVSDDIVDYLVDGYGCSRTKIHTTINGIDMDKFRPDIPYAAELEALGLSSADDRVRLVYMSRLDEDRAAYAFTIARIAPRLAEKYPDLDIIIVGGGTEEEKIRQLADTANKEAGRQIVTMTGNRSDTNVFTAAADVFVGVSRSALEAMAASRPVIVAGNQGVLGIFEESKLRPAMDTNFCCRGFDGYTDEGLLADISVLLDESPETRAARGVWCRQVVQTYYTAARMADDYEKMYEKVLASPVPFRGRGDVMISGYYGFGNLGDESLLSAIADSLAKECPGIRITALTKNPRKDSERTGLRCIGRMNFPAIFHEMGRAKLLISGGGSLLQDVTSGKSLLYYLTLIRLAEKKGLKTFLYANGIGPLNSEKNRARTGNVVQCCDAISVRDEDSLHELVSLGIPAEKIRLSADPAFCVPMPVQSKQISARKRFGLDTLPPAGQTTSDEEIRGYYVISLRRLMRPMTEGYDVRLAEETASFCDRIWEEYRLIPVFAPMQPQNDRDICADTAARTKAPARIADIRDVEDLLALLTGAGFVLGMRLHSLIYAAAAATPVIGISYDPKIDAFLKRIGQPAGIPVDAITADELYEKTKKLLDNNQTIRKELRTHTTELNRISTADAKEAVQLM
ncbi:MAG: polysaccharide pyruvyl transferase CsaB [Ruminococcaceae bacterium]|nr:polysaccharide pyruvyl transferase CsaB [Oscillospiraceae bacterium]